jgi:mitogen-activated protein kinase kinase
MAGSSSLDDGINRLTNQAQSSLSLNSSSDTNSADDALPTASRSADAPIGSRQMNAIGSGGGGPPARLNSPSVSSSNTQSPNLRLASGGPGRIGSGGGGPGSRTSANEMTRQMASTKLPPSLQARLAANANRSSASPSGNASPATGSSSPFASGNVVRADQKLDMAAFTNNSQPSSNSSSANPSLNNFHIPPTGLRPAPGLPPGAKPPSGPVGGMGGLGNRRKGPGLKLSDLSSQEGDNQQAGASGQSGQVNAAGQGEGSKATNGSVGPGRRLAPPGKLASASNGLMSSAFDMHKNIVDPSGRLRFDGKAVLSASGVEFRNGTSFKINMDDLDLLDELGKGAYGTVRKVRHTKTRVEMAMKEIRLELDDSKLNGIIMELDILHRASAPEIVEFYGAFFYESCVYYCMEFMDAGSLEDLYDGPCSVPEDVLARIVGCTVRGLRFLKDNLQIMHRDVKPTNIVLNRKGEVKLCDFGVSGQLEKSLAKTNIGCQSYMAPERIKGESQNLLGTYTVASDVWSLGLSIVETTMGTYPYPPETYSNVFAQLQAIVHGDPPQIPGDFYSSTARDFVAGCLEKVPAKRSTYKQMLEHPWLVQDKERADGVDMQGWIKVAIERREVRREKERSQVKIEG